MLHIFVCSPGERGMSAHLYLEGAEIVLDRLRIDWGLPTCIFLGINCGELQLGLETLSP